LRRPPSLLRAANAKRNAPTPEYERLATHLEQRCKPGQRSARAVLRVVEDEAVALAVLGFAVSIRSDRPSCLSAGQSALAQAADVAGKQPTIGTDQAAVGSLHLQFLPAVE
jgi:hypothetical protein